MKREIVRLYFERRLLWEALQQLLAGASDRQETLRAQDAYRRLIRGLQIVTGGGMTEIDTGGAVHTVQGSSCDCPTAKEGRPCVHPTIVALYQAYRDLYIQRPSTERNLP